MPAPRRRAPAIALGLTLLALAATPAGAQTPYRDIASSGPLTNIYIGNELGCQVKHSADSQLELFPSGARPGDCGTIVRQTGVLYAPDFNNHAGGSTATSGLGATTDWTPVSQSPVTGDGSEASPFTVQTVVTGGSLRITQTDSYITNREGYRTDIKVENTGGSLLNGILYRGGDCFLQNSDQGFGFVDTSVGAAGCSQNANNSPVGRIEQWYPITAGANYMEASFSAVWSAIGSGNPLPNTCQCASSTDNGAAISWSYSLNGGQSATYSHFTVFSPQGSAGPPQPLPPPSPPGGGSSNTPPTTTTSTPPTTTTTPRPTPRPGPGTFNRQTPPAFGPGGIVAGLPSTRRCVSKRRFVIRIRKRRGRTYSSVQVFLNRRSVATRRGSRTTAPINLRGLPKGRYTVRIVVVTTRGEVIAGTRKYRTCTKKQRRRGRPGPL
jgi:hypothetical protein